MPQGEYMFSQSVIEKIGYYVYFLRDKRDDKIFYVGKGYGNRVFNHLECALDFPNESDKIIKIKEILASGSEVEHFILRHGLTEEVALEIESSIIDLIGLDKVTNIVSGHNAFGFGLKSVDEIKIQYEAEEVIIDDPVILININKKYQRNMSASDLYEATRSAWVVALRRNKAKYALSCYKGIIREVYEISIWSKVNNKRWEFEGKIAQDEIRNKYLHKSISKYVVKGKANPINYVKC